MTSIRSLFAVFPRLVVVACSWSCQLGLWLKFDTRGWVKQTVTGCTSNWQGRPRRHDDEDFQHEPWNDKAISSCSTQLVHQDSVTWLRGRMTRRDSTGEWMSSSASLFRCLCPGTNHFNHKVYYTLTLQGISFISLFGGGTNHQNNHHYRLSTQLKDPLLNEFIILHLLLPIIILKPQFEWHGNRCRKIQLAIRFTLPCRSLRRLSIVEGS